MMMLRILIVYYVIEENIKHAICHQHMLVLSNSFLFYFPLENSSPIMFHYFFSAGELINFPETC